jgi:uncharacterized repeat protein (TIGR02543 family)
MTEIKDEAWDRRRAMRNEKAINNSNLRVSHRFYSIILCSLLLAICSLTFLSCQNSFVPEDDAPLPANCGTVSLSLADNNMRTILPAAPMIGDIAVYELNFVAAGGGAVNKTITLAHPDVMDPVILVAGTYNLTVNAYKVSKAPSNLIAQAITNSIAIIPGTDISVTVVFKPLYGGTGYNGSFRYNITLNTSTITLTGATMSIWNSGGTQVGSNVTLTTTGTKQTTGSISLASGMYTVKFIITGTKATTPVTPYTFEWNELMHVYANLESGFTHEFKDTNFHNTHWNVTFDASYGGSYEFGSHPNLDIARATQSILHNGKITVTPPVRPGYRFDGWFTETAFTNQWTLATDSVVKDMTLYAKWTANTKTITVSVDSIVDGTAAADKALVIPDITKGSSAASTISLTGTYDSIAWKVSKIGDPSQKVSIGTAASLSLNGTNANYNTVGGHFVELTVTKGGKEYRVNIPFKVV